MAKQYVIVLTSRKKFCMMSRSSDMSFTNSFFTATSVPWTIPFQTSPNALLILKKFNRKLWLTSELAHSSLFPLLKIGLYPLPRSFTSCISFACISAPWFSPTCSLQLIKTKVRISKTGGKTQLSYVRRRSWICWSTELMEGLWSSWATLLSTWDLIASISSVDISDPGWSNSQRCTWDPACKFHPPNY